jgi:hypothetical protein
MEPHQQQQQQQQRMEDDAAGAPSRDQFSSPSEEATSLRFLRLKEYFRRMITLGPDTIDEQVRSRAGVAARAAATALLFVRAARARRTPKNAHHHTAKQ